MRGLTLATCFSVVAVAQSELSGLPISGPLGSGVGNSTAQKVSEQAGRSPNATSSVTFTRYYNNTPEDWVWRINITEFAVSDPIYDLGTQSANFSKGFRVVNTQWQLDWPGDGNQTLQKLLEDRQQSVYINSLAWNYPPNITSNYSESDNGNCANILGANCSQSLMMAASRGRDFDISSLNGCENTLSIPSSGNTAGVGFGISSNASDGAGLQRDDTLYYQTSGAYSPGNASILHEAETALQILMLSFSTTALQSNSGDNQPNVLCRIVDKTATSAAVKWQASAIVLRTLVLSCVLFVWS